MIGRWIVARIKRIPWWGWLLILATACVWLPLLILASPVIAIVAAVLFVYRMFAVQPPRRRRRVHITGRATVRTTRTRTSHPGRPGRNPYRP